MSVGVNMSVVWKQDWIFWIVCDCSKYIWIICEVVGVVEVWLKFHTFLPVGVSISPENCQTRLNLNVWMQFKRCVHDSLTVELMRMSFAHFSQSLI